MRRRFALLVIVVALGGCRSAESPENGALRSTIERGPLTLELAVTPASIAVGDEVTVRLTVTTPEDHHVVFPGADAFGDIPIEVDPSQIPRPGPTGIVWEQVYRFTPLESGAVELPPLAVEYWRKPAGAETQPAGANELVSEPLTVEVASALTADDTPEQPREITGPMVPPEAPWPWWYYALFLFVIHAWPIALLALIRWVRARRMRPPPPIAPEVWALRELDVLGRQDWFSNGRVQDYYYRLTEVVRGYVEKKFGLAAPEMTTEEFLGMLARNQQAVPYDADRLRVFLEACDFVKYAAFDPRPEDAQAALSTARSFVDATAAASQQNQTAPVAAAPTTPTANTVCLRPPTSDDDTAGGAAK